MPPAPTTKGPLDRIPCPHCGKPNGLQEYDEDQLLDTGHRFGCDHCHRLMEVAAIKTVKFVHVRPIAGSAQQGPPPARPATTLGASAMRRLLGK